MILPRCIAAKPKLTSSTRANSPTANRQMYSMERRDANANTRKAAAAGIPSPSKESPENQAGLAIHSPPQFVGQRRFFVPRLVPPSRLFHPMAVSVANSDASVSGSFIATPPKQQRPA